MRIRANVGGTPVARKTQRNISSKKIRDLTAEVVEEVKIEVRGFIIDEVRQMNRTERTEPRREKDSSTR